MSGIPSWLQENQTYKAENKSSAFLDKTVLHLTSTIHRFHQLPKDKVKPQPIIFLLLILVSIVCMSICRNMLFTYSLLALLIIYLCTLNNDDLSYVIHLSFRAFIISCILLCPSIFLSSPSTMLTVSLKVFVSVSLVGIFNVLYSTNELISCMKMLHIPNIFIMTLDMAFKYIVLLSKVSEEILNALKCRLIGTFQTKDQTMMYVASKVYIKSDTQNKEMNDAMKCRGFNGVYYNHLQFHLNHLDIILFAFIILEIVLCIYLGGNV